MDDAESRLPRAAASFAAADLDPARSVIEAVSEAAGGRSDLVLQVTPTGDAPNVTRVFDDLQVADAPDGTTFVARREAAEPREFATQLHQEARPKSKLSDGGAKRAVSGCRGRPLSPGSRRQIMHLLDLQESGRGPKLTLKRIAELTDRHVNTVFKMKKQRDAQECRRVQEGDVIRTVEVPVAGRQGGFRWCRMDEAQKRLCTQIAVENPRLTVTQVRQAMQERDPSLSVSDATVWRALHTSKLQVLRAKLRDPLRDATKAREEERAAFFEEQLKGPAGEFDPFELFLMDETTVYLNETMRRAWGTVEHPAEIKKAKGKTVSIGVYAGIGIVREALSPGEWDERRSRLPTPTRMTDGRSNAFRLEDGAWRTAEQPPRFAIFWWLRPPARKSTVLPRFLQVDDILDPNMSYCVPASPGHDERCGAFVAGGRVDEPFARSMLAFDFSTLEYDALQQALWRNNVEWRRVDEEGQLVSILPRGAKVSHRVLLDRGAMVELMRSLQALVARALRFALPPSGSAVAERAEPAAVPRAYYTQLGRSLKGGRLDTERGDQSLFLQYIKKTVKYYETCFPAAAKSNLRMAWDSAPQHGKVDVGSNKKSFIHDWVTNTFGIRGALFLPVRDPDYNPAELLFAFVKGVVRRKMQSPTGEVSVETMVRMLDEAFLEVTEQMIRGWLRHGCYRIQGDHPARLEKSPRCKVLPQVDLGAIRATLVSAWESENGALATERRTSLLGAQRHPGAFSRFATLAEATDAVEDGRIFVMAFQLKPGAAAELPRPLDPPVQVDPADLRARLEPQMHDAFSRRPSEASGGRKPLAATAPVYVVSKEPGPSAEARHFCEAHDNLDDPRLRPLLAALEMEPFDLAMHFVASQLVVSQETRDKLDALRGQLSASRGLLYHLKQASDLVDAWLRRVTPAFRGPCDDSLALVLDVQERVFDAKLHVGSRLRLLDAPTDGSPLVFAFADDAKGERHVPFRMALSARDAGQHAPDAEALFTIKSVDARTTTVSDGSRAIRVDNPSMYASVAEAAADGSPAPRIGRIMEGTPYRPSVEAVAGSPGYPYALAAIALRAFRFEQARGEELKDSFVRAFLRLCEGHRGETRAPALESGLKLLATTLLAKWLRKCRSGACVGEDGRLLHGEPDASAMDADNEAPLLDVASMRAERRAAVELRQSGKERGRRWPGYPASERDERDGEKIHQVDPGKRINVEPMQPVKAVHVHEVRERGGATFFTATVTFEDDSAEIVGGNMPDLDSRDARPFIEEFNRAFARIFGEYSQENRAKLDHALQRYRERRAKDASESGASLHKNAVLAVYRDMTVRFQGGGRERLPVDELYLFFHPEKGAFYPPVGMTKAEVEQAGGPFPVFLYDEERIRRMVDEDDAAATFSRLKFGHKAFLSPADGPRVIEYSFRLLLDRALVRQLNDRYYYVEHPHGLAAATTNEETFRTLGSNPFLVRRRALRGSGKAVAVTAGARIIIPKKRLARIYEKSLARCRREGIDALDGVWDFDEAYYERAPAEP